MLSRLGRANASHGLYGEPVRLQFGMASAKYLKDLLAAPSRRIGDHATPADVVAARSVEELESGASIGARPKANRWAMSCMANEQRGVVVLLIAGSHGHGPAVHSSAARVRVAAI